MLITRASECYLCGVEPEQDFLAFEFTGLCSLQAK